jgi:hypothetical protein
MNEESLGLTQRFDAAWKLRLTLAVECDADNDLDPLKLDVLSCFCVFSFIGCEALRLPVYEQT